MRTNYFNKGDGRYRRLLFVILVVLMGSTATSDAQTDTISVANFMNGNNEAFNSHVYLWNPGASSGKCC